MSAASVQKYHVVCTLLDKREYEYFLTHEEEEFVCHCSDIKSFTLKKELNEIKTDLEKQDQLTHLQETICFISKQFDDILKGVGDNKKKIETIQRGEKC